MKGISGMSDGSVAAWWRRVLRADADGWDRRPERRELYADYAAFCKRACAEPVGLDAFLLPQVIEFPKTSSAREVSLDIMRLF